MTYSLYEAEKVIARCNAGTAAPIEVAGHLPGAHDEIRKLRAELETARALADVRGNEVARLAHELGTVKAQRDKLKRACRAALGTWCPRGNPRGDGADGETYQLCESAIALESGR